MIGIGPDQRRRVLGVSCALSEAEVAGAPSWRPWLPVARGVAYIVSDDHPGLGAARKAVLGGAVGGALSVQGIWLRKRHPSTPPTSPSERPSARSCAGSGTPPTASAAEAELGHLVAAYRDSAPKLADWLETAIPEGLAVFALPEATNKRMRTSNANRSIQQEIKRSAP